MYNIPVILPAFTGKQYNGPVIQTHLSLYPLLGIWQGLGPHRGGICSQRVAQGWGILQFIIKLIAWLLSSMTLGELRTVKNEGNQLIVDVLKHKTMK